MTSLPTATSVSRTFSHQPGEAGQAHVERVVAVEVATHLLEVERARQHVPVVARGVVGLAAERLGAVAHAGEAAALAAAFEGDEDRGEALLGEAEGLVDAAPLRVVEVV